MNSSRQKRNKGAVRVVWNGNQKYHTAIKRQDHNAWYYVCCRGVLGGKGPPEEEDLTNAL